MNSIEQQPMTQETTDQLDRARELIAETERVRQWLDRLDGEQSDRPPHIVEKVRTDYVDRLARLTEELRSHRTTVENSLEEARRTLDERETALGDLRDRFEELRLRHEIGEISEEEWGAERPRVETETTKAEQERDTERERFDGLEALLAELGAESAEAEPEPHSVDDGEVEASGGGASTEDPIAATPVQDDVADEAAAAEASVDEAFEQWEAPEEEPEADPSEAAEERTGSEGDEDLAFLRDLDRSIASPEARPPKSAPAADLGESDATTQRLPCKECGAVNDPRAWYCEVCGMELS